ncbi:MAG: hypothetical protein AAFU73_01025 [Planctomycetota bacterium]
MRPLLPLAALGLPAAAFAQGGLPVDLSTWQVIQYQFNSQPDASWDLQTGNTAVLQSVNSDASIFLSDFDSVGQEINGTWSVETSSDDDFMGFVFGYQDRGHYYLFDWKQNSQSFGGTFAEVGMSLKAVSIPGGADPVIADLWPSTSSTNVTVLEHNTVPWDEFIEYEFTLLFTPGRIEIEVREGMTVLESWVVNDSTYTDGEFGFYNFSQGDVLYQGFERVGVPEVYCDAKVNSLGCTPALNVAGSASLSDPVPFTVDATNLINQQFSTLMVSTMDRENLPFGGGTLCIAMPFMDTGTQLTGGDLTGPSCTGTFSMDVNAYLQGGAGFVAGDRIYAQVFYRDPLHPDGTGFGLTEAVDFVVLP